MWTKQMLNSLWVVITVLVIGCGAKEAVHQVANDLNIQGHWLMTESKHAKNPLEQVAADKSMVLTFKDGQAAFSPTDKDAFIDKVKAKTVFFLLQPCDKGPRPFKMEKDEIVFPAVNQCAEKRWSVLTLDGQNLKTGDGDVNRSFVKINDERYNNLVERSQQQPQP